jgi:hypothetical protein
LAPATIAASMRSRRCPNTPLTSKTVIGIRRHHWKQVWTRRTGHRRLVRAHQPDARHLPTLIGFFNTNNHVNLLHTFRISDAAVAFRLSAALFKPTVPMRQFWAFTCSGSQGKTNILANTEQNKCAHPACRCFVANQKTYSANAARTRVTK